MNAETMDIIGERQALARLYEAKPPRMPNLFLIGAMRAGSTSLHNLLTQHPEIFMSEVKEPGFFIAEAARRLLEIGDVDERTTEEGLANFIANGKHRTPQKYADLFAEAGGNPFRGESSHYLYHPTVAPAIQRYAPEARIIISARNPVDRLFSEYMYYQRTGQVEGSFADFAWEGCKKNANGKYVPADAFCRFNKGCYARLAEPWFEAFGPKQVRIVRFDEMISDNAAVCRSLFEWLGIDPDVTPVRVHAERSGKPKSKLAGAVVQSSGGFSGMVKRLLPRAARTRIRDVFYKVALEKEEMDDTIRAELAEAYRPDIEDLEQLAGIDLSSWKK